MVVWSVHTLLSMDATPVLHYQHWYHYQHTYVSHTERVLVLIQYISIDAAVKLYKMADALHHTGSVLHKQQPHVCRWKFNDG